MCEKSILEIEWKIHYQKRNLEILPMDIFLHAR